MQITSRIILLFLLINQPLAQASDQTTEKATVKAAKIERSFQRHSSYVPSVAFSPDGRRLASAGVDRVKVTDLETGKEILKLKNSRNMTFRSVAFSPNGRWLAGGQSYLKNRVTRPKGDLLVTTFFHYGEVLIWDANSGALQTTINYQNYPAWQVVFSPDNHWLAIATGPVAEDEKKDCKKEVCEGFGEVFLYETSTWKLVSRLKGNTLPIRKVVFSPDSRWLVGSSRMIEDVRAFGNDGGYEIFVWDVAAGKLKTTLPGHSRAITAIAFSGDGRLLASAGRDLSLKIWDMENFRLLRMASEFMISYDELETITEKAGKKKAKDALPRISWLSGIVFTKDGGQIIGCGGDGILRIYNTDSGKIEHIVKPRDWPISSWDQTWDWNPSGLLSNPRFYNWNSIALYGHLNCIALSPDGTTLATGGADGKIRVMSLD